jgi:putative ABC transport system permease protein
MFKSYLKTALRFLLKNKTFSFINIFGLATGTLCCLYILLYVQDQFSYDKHHKNAADIYRVTTALQLTGDKHTNSTASPPIAPAIKKDFAEVEQYTRVVPTATLGGRQHLLRYKEKSFYDKSAFYVDSTFFDVFTYHFVNGNAPKVLDQAYSIVIQKTLADKLFGQEDPIGKMVNIDNAFGKHDFKVTGVVDNSEGKSHIEGDIFITMRSGDFGLYVLNNNVWGGNNFTNSYIKLRPGTSAAALEAKLPSFIDKYGGAQMKTLGMTKQLHLQPITAIHTSTGYEIELSKSISPSFLYILLLIAVMIQVIACINFMNLSTARASKRAKEVGVRKVIGAGRADLVKQFLGESFFLSLIGVLIALPLLVLLLPYLNQLTHTDIRLSFFSDYRLYIMLVSLIVITGFVAGSYPAFYLSAFRTIKVIKGNFTSHVSVAGIRRSLVVFQFVLSIVLISGIIIIYSQLNYIKNKDIGFDANQRLIFNFYTADAQKQMPAFMTDLKQLSDVKVVSKADNYLSQFVGHDHGVYLAGGNMAQATDAQNISTDEFFVKANGIKLAEGRDFRLNDSNRVLINETMAKRLGIKPGAATGTRLYSQYDNNPATFVEVVGIMKDFNYNSLHGEVRPFMLMYEPNRGDINAVIVATNSSNYQSLLSQMEAVWHKDLPGVPFEYTFLNEAVQKQYETEITLSSIINSFTLMAVLISCLGLFGLAAFSAEQRSKEISIRKVLGASATGIAGLLSKDFLKLVLIAFLIATPISWWAMNQWLQAFVYRTSISWWMFGLSGMVTLMISLLTISSQAIKAAVTNPVKSLRSE